MQYRLPLQKFDANNLLIFFKLISDKIIVFDGYCRLCSGLVSFLINADRKKQFNYIASQSDEGLQIIQDYKLNDVQMSIYFIEEKKVYDRSQAVFHIAGNLGFPYVLILIFGVLGRPINDGLYSLIAKSRFRIFGKRKTCMIPKSTKDFQTQS